MQPSKLTLDDYCLAKQYLILPGFQNICIFIRNKKSELIAYIKASDVTTKYFWLSVISPKSLPPTMMQSEPNKCTLCREG